MAAKVIFKKSPIHPWEFHRKSRFEDSRAVFWSLSGYKKRKITTKPFAGRVLRDLLIQITDPDAKYSSGIRRKPAKFRD